MSVYDWIIGIGLIFGIGFFLTYITYQDIKVFFVWCLIINGFIVWSGLLPLWSLILNLMIISIILYIHFYKGDTKI